MPDSAASGNRNVIRRICWHLERFSKLPLQRFPLREKPDYHVPRGVRSHKGRRNFEGEFCLSEARGQGEPNNNGSDLLGMDQLKDVKAAIDWDPVNRSGRLYET
jgi:hypothetical protein